MLVSGNFREMDEPAKTGAEAPAAPATEAAEFAALPRSRTRHPLLAVGAAALALFLCLKMRPDVTYAVSSSDPVDLGNARALLSSNSGREFLAGTVNRLVRIAGVPDRESALQVDTRGSWTFTQFFRILGTDSRIFVHRRESPVPAFRAEEDEFEGRLLKFTDLSFEDAIRSYFAGHVSATHFFRSGDLAQAVVTAGDWARPVEIADLAGDKVALGPNDILAIDLRHAGEVEVSLPAERFRTADKAAAALTAQGARLLRPGQPAPERQTWVIAVPAAERDALLHRVGNVDWQSTIREVRETVKARLADLTVTGAGATRQLALRTAAGGAGRDGAGGAGGAGKTSGESGAAAAAALRPLTDIRSVRTLSTVQIPHDAYLIVEAEMPRDRLPQLAIAAVLLVFAAFNLIGLLRELRR
jgi:hypothetical protein